MTDTQIFGIGVTGILLVVLSFWSWGSWRRFFLVVTIMGIAGSVRVGTESGGVYPYEILFIAGGALYLIRQKGRSLQSVRQLYILFAALSGWWILGALIDIFITQPDLGFLAGLGLATDDLQTKFLGHLVITILLMCIAFWVGGKLFSSESHLKALLWGVIAGTTLCCLATIFEWAKVTGALIARYNFDPPMGLGEGESSRMLLIGAVCCLVLLVRKAPTHKKLLIGTFILHVFALILIQSRQGYFAALIHLGVVTVLCVSANRLYAERSKKTLMLVALPYVIGLLALGVFQLVSDTGFTKSYSSLENASSQDRTNKARLFQSALDIFDAHPFFGVGRGQFEIYEEVPMKVSGASVYVATPHNGFGELLAETGIPGTILAYLLSVLIIYRLWRVYKGPYLPITRGLAGALCFMFFYVTAMSFIQSSSIFPTPLQRDMSRVAFVYWLLGGLAVSARREMAMPQMILARFKRAPRQATDIAFAGEDHVA